MTSLRTYTPRPGDALKAKMSKASDRIVELPAALMTGGRSCYFDLDESRLPLGLPDGGGPLDAPDNLPFGGAWNWEVHDLQLSYGSVLRPGWL